MQRVRCICRMYAQIKGSNIWLRRNKHNVQVQQGYTPRACHKRVLRVPVCLLCFVHVSISTSVLARCIYVRIVFMSQHVRNMRS